MSMRPLTLQDLFNGLAGSINTNSDTSAQFQIIDNLVSSPETLKLNVSGSVPTVTTRTPYPVLVNGDYPTTYWRLAETSGAVAYDSNQNLFSPYPRISSSSQTSVTQGATSFLAGSSAAQFTASTSAITFANNSSLQIIADLTIEFWVNFSSFGTTGTTYSLLGKGVTGTGSTGEYEVYLTNSAGAGQLNFRQNNAYTTLNATTTITTGAWYHVAIVRNSSAATVTFYINGTAAGSNAYVVATTTTGNVVLGAQGSYSTLTLSMTEVALYHKALTSTQIANHHGWGVASSAVAVAYNSSAAQYGLFPYPALTPPTSEAYGSGTTWGTFVWK